MSQPPDDRIIAAKVSLAHEPSAVVLLQRVEELTGEFAADIWQTKIRYEAPYVERVPGGSSPSVIADALAELVAEAKDDRAARVSVVVDLTAPGVPFLKLLRERGVRAAPVMVGDAALVQADTRLWNLPSREIVSVTLAVMAEKRLAIAGELPDAGKMVEQIEAYRIKQPPRDALSDWRPAPHVDLAGALMLACWWGERMLRSIVRQPPVPRQPISPAQVPTFDQAVAMARRQRRAG